MIANHGVLFEHLTAMQKVLCSIPNTDEPNTLKVPKLGLRPPWQTHLLDPPPPIYLRVPIIADEKYRSFLYYSLYVSCLSHVKNSMQIPALFIYLTKLE